MALKHATRNLHLQTALGPDVLQVTRFQAAEELSAPFYFNLELISDNAKIAAEDIIGTNATIAIDIAAGGQRFFNGFVQRFSALDEDNLGTRYYRAVMVPWMWFLTQTNDCRIFQEMTIVKIIEKIFNDLGFTDFDTSKISGNHPKREYCVQYRETDFDFVCRLMEEEGIFYFFVHENGKHTLHLADSASVYKDCQESTVDYYKSKLDTRELKAQIHGWEHNYQFRPGAWAHTDYNFKKPRDRLMAAEKTVMKFKSAKNFEVYDYPGEYHAKGDGAALARIRMEELELEHDTVTGSSGCMSFSPGQKFKVGKHRAKTEEGKSYVIKKILHLAEEHTYETDPVDPGFAYTNQFECFPDKATFRPARLTPKPVVRGCQTAVVTGPPGEEIFPDEHGRVKVQFHWDREGKFDDKSSCWIRVSQIHAGKGWGYMDIPRIGEEVIVDFMEGDPDQPIIVGRVYNGDNKPPYDLPAGKTRRGNKTKTYKGSGFNEMSMDDTPGKEQIRIHGQYNMDTEVQNDETHTIHNNRTKTIGVDETMTIGNNQKLDVGVNKTVSVGTNHMETIGSNQKVTVGSNQSISVGSSQTNSVGKTKNETVGMMSNEMVGIMKATNVGAVYSIISGAAMNTAVGFVSAEEVGMNKTVIVGSSLKISAGSKIEIACGASKITMDAGGKVTISGTSFNFSASGPVKINGAIIDLN
ncbi:MAG: type VI secretion system tip protein VgrG [Pirellulaceae bacterium]|nr:type VI secretion system tip protein VgrG [Pirellulaceae bacterium]